MNLGGEPNVLALEEQGEEGPPGSHGGSGPQTNPWTGKTSGGSGSGGQSSGGPTSGGGNPGMSQDPFAQQPKPQESTEQEYEAWYNWQESVLGGHTYLDFEDY